MPDVVLMERRGSMATVMLNRPQRLNALDRAMWVRLGEVMRALSREDGIGCVVLRGAGTEAFSPGHDIAEFESELGDSRRARAYGRLMGDTYQAVRDCPHPTIAMVHGVCTGGGLELALHCDLRIGAATSRYGLPINRIGVALSYPLLATLIDAVGRPTALEILLEARVFDAEEALGKGLLTRVVPDAELATAVEESAARICTGAPLVNRWHKAYAQRLADPRPISDAELADSYACWDTEDLRVGYQAFLNKTKPVFSGR